jgi:hypothetical protein
MIKDSLESLKGREVEVVYNGVVYRGTLSGASEDEVYLETRTDWVSLPMADITELRAAEPFQGFQTE